jgi:hypothetical protein
MKKFERRDIIGYLPNIRRETDEYYKETYPYRCPGTI